MTQAPTLDGLVVARRKRDTYSVFSNAPGAPLRCEVSELGDISAVQEAEHTPDKWPSEFVTPGLIDIQVNGFAGVDFNSDGLTSAQMDHALGHLAASGVTCVLPTLITAFEPRLISLLEALDKAVSQSVLGPLMVAGYHIEGPFLSPKEGCSGAHPAAAMRPASKDLVRRLEDVSSRPIRIMTVAPEQEGVLELIPFLVDRGIVCAIGHTDASRSDIDAAISAGATMSTHLGNGLPHILNKHENPLFSQLGRDELIASFIADGIHVHPETLQTYFRAKTLERSIITTDAVAPAGKDMKPGLYTLSSTQVERHADGTVRIPGSTYLAGSSATMDDMVRNLMDWYGFSMRDILKLARDNPTPIVEDFVHQPALGSKVDFVKWHHKNGTLRVRETYIGPWVIKSAT